MTLNPEPQEIPPNDQIILVIPDSVLAEAINDVGQFFEKINGIDRNAAAAEHLDYRKSFRRAALLQRYSALQGRKLLEIGSGYGTNLAAWIKAFGVDGYGVEPGSFGFQASYRASKAVFEANGLDPGRIIDGVGEALPFGDQSMDIVYSANVLGSVDEVGFPNHLIADSRVLFEESGLGSWLDVG